MTPKAAGASALGGTIGGVTDTVEAVGARLEYLPPYSPGLNPIELAFAKLKALLLKAAARTTEQLEQATAEAIQHFPAEQCLAYFRHCGYSER